MNDSDPSAKIHGDSPLSHFVAAKKAILGIFSELLCLLQSTENFFASQNSDERESEAIEKYQKKTTSHVQKIMTVTKILKRDRMKVAFFGRTSNGKSTVINSILSDKVLPSAMGHTTSCFISVQACDEKDEPYILTPDSSEKKSIDILNQLANAVEHGRLDSSGLIQLYWPVSRCPILKNDVVFVDSPGVDVSEDMDLWIEKYCRDADVFVLVVNAESTLNIAEKNFFIKVNKMLSRPNIYILNNRWDFSSYEDKVEAIKSQHLDRNVEFLTKELNCCSKNEAIHRVFFVSAREVLHERLKSSTQNSNFRTIHRSLTITDQDCPGRDERLTEFNRFEKSFQECLSRSAIITKFQSHSSMAISLIDVAINDMQSAVNWFRLKLKSVTSRLNESKQLHAGIVENKHKLEKYNIKIDEICHKIKADVYNTVLEEINVVEKLVDEFDHPFSPEPRFFKIYHASLVEYLQKGLERKISSKCLETVTHPVTDLMKEIDKLMVHLENDENLSPRSPELINNISKFLDPNSTSWFFCIDIKSLCSDFVPDFSFSFSLNPTFIARQAFSLMNSHHDSLLESEMDEKSDLNLSTPNSGDERSTKRDEAKSIDVYNKPININVRSNEIPKNLIPSTSRYVLIGSTVSYRFFGGLSFFPSLFLGYSTAYGVERALWTASKKEKIYKYQFSMHLIKKLSNFINAISSNVARMAQEKLSNTIQETSYKLERDMLHKLVAIQSDESEIGKFEECIEKASQFIKNYTDQKKVVNNFIIDNGLITNGIDIL